MSQRPEIVIHPSGEAIANSAGINQQPGTVIERSRPFQENAQVSEQSKSPLRLNNAAKRFMILDLHHVIPQGVSWVSHRLGEILDC